MKIALVQAMCGHVTCVGPNDFMKSEYDDAMSAAIGWHIEAGYMPAATYWVEVELPASPRVPGLKGMIIDGAPHDQ